MKKVFLLTFFVLCFMIGSRTVYASEIIDTRNTESTETSSEELEDTGNAITDTYGDPFVTSQEQGIVPNVTVEGFFTHLYNKELSAITYIQKILCPFFVVCFLVCLIMSAVAFFGKKADTIKYLFGSLICVILFTCTLYAIPIMQSFNRWFMS